MGLLAVRSALNWSAATAGELRSDIDPVEVGGILAGCSPWPAHPSSVPS
ncbi:hypothetical protein [Streptomyces subrutilus]|nr:hypothetical protein [Streptomyces subrutilus]